MSPASLFIPAVLIAALTLLFGAWSFIVRRSGSTLGATSLATGTGLVTLALSVFVMRAIDPSTFAGEWWPAWAALAVFCVVLMVHAIRNAPKVGAIMLGYLMGLMTLVICGQVLWLALSCGMGNCL